jgi:hypothetical protein
MQTNTVLRIRQFQPIHAPLMIKLWRSFKNLSLEQNQRFISVEVLNNYERLSLRWSRIQSCYTKLEVNNGVQNWTIF